MTPAELTAALDRVDNDTTLVAAVVRSLRDRITTSMTAEDVAAVKGKLDEIGTRLEGTAADPANPVPPGPAPTPLAKK